MWAHSLGLTGFVYNDSQGVYVEIQGCTSDLQLFLDAIQDDQPRLCRITSQGYNILLYKTMKLSSL